MKKVFSISLLCTFLFYAIGYHFVFLGIQYHGESQMSQKLDAERYLADETITLKIPLTVPYYTQSKEYERVDGEFQHEGEFYKLVKQKLDRDTLYVVCIHDVRAKSLDLAMTDFVKMTNDMAGSQSQSLKLSASFAKDYAPSLSLRLAVSRGWTREQLFSSSTFNLLTATRQVLSPPPRSIS